MKKLFIYGVLLLCTVEALARQAAMDTVLTATIDEVVVTGQFVPQSLRSSLFKVKVIGSATLRQKAAVTPESALNTVMGIRLNNDMNTGETDFEIMGMSGQNVKVLLDGVPLVDRSSTRQCLSQLDVNTIARIEIVEGPMSVNYGADALAGVVNIITKQATPDAGRLSLSAKVQEESAGSEYSPFAGKGRHNENISAGYTFNKGFYVSAAFTRNAFGGWQGDLTGRKKQWHPKMQYLSGLKAGYSGAKTTVWYRLDYLNENILTEEDVNSVTNMTSDCEFITGRYTHLLQGGHTVSSRLRIDVAGSWQDYHRRTRTTLIHTDTGKRTLSLADGAQAQIDYSSLFGRLTGVWTASDVLSLQPGIEYHSTEGTGDRIDGTRAVTDAAVFVAAEYRPFRWLNIRPGVRSSHNSAYDAPPVTPSLNVKFRPCEAVDLRLSYGRGFRAPSLQELYYSFHDANHNIDGNPDLKAEDSDSYMASVTWRNRAAAVQLSSALSGFFNDFRNRISLVESYADAGLYTYYNIDRYRTVGLTLESGLQWAALQADVGVACVGRMNSYYGDAQYSTVEMSRYRFSPEISAGISWAPARVGTFSLFYKMNGARREYTLDGTDLKLLGIDAYHWLDVTLGRTLGAHWLVQAGVKNLLNVTTVRNTGGSDSPHDSGTGISHAGYGRSAFCAVIFTL
ncbi:MAG: TonB-dependent receptor [Bacteroidales bacterium]|nr:TonB-dependent receptor [Bacteroidales bacterium]